jgi:hypothetical protein
VDRIWRSSLFDQVGDAVRNDPSFPASRAGKDEKRTLCIGHRLALLFVQAFEQIHGECAISK